ncbi:asparaginase [Mycolicibacillus parakoreensis]|uniref:asparaginase n=1 Tax=Mycolicibacillus parakoreensis TaxID=1069221 RepID=A0ABY3TU39_9MYCO|nr:asparaginase domain-containing protein [Mycolicibacillus parakoreensis]MCV7316784.1 asparaginase [Mycolicibacillus parakoreensis]ULN51155.1 asparaginase domain-containing protein [Mycolicibacillus parakoreensis]HLR99721.1 asparaginase domain-containing protein [Mycolicibacillus parakoreensis]
MRTVTVITTGGTIATSADERGVLRPTRTGADLVAGAATPAGLDVVVTDLLARDSAALTPADWQTITSAVSDAAGRGPVVLTHGTDSIEETALWLELAYAGTAPVVITGAQRGGDAPDADGPGNLADALTVAADPAAAGRGVLVCFAGRILTPLGLQKASTTELGCYTGQVVGTVAAHTVRFTADPPRPRLDRAPAGPPRVDIVAAYPGADAVALAACVSAGAAAVVLEGLGCGNAGPDLIDGVRAAVDTGVAVVVSTRVPHGGVEPRYAPGHALLAAGAVLAERLRPPQTRVLVMAALAAGTPVDEAVRRWG